MEHYASAAIRHYADAQVLRQTGQLDNAGHLIGFAGECAIKYHLTTLKPGQANVYLHLPALLTIARKHPNGRGSADTVRQNMFCGWTVERRYFKTGHTSAEELVRWFKDASLLFRAAKLKGLP